MNEQIGRYRLISPLGEGAMASVYLAELETDIGFKRKVALKVVRSEYARDKKFIALMGREAMIGSLLQHPNIVQTLEFNEADGRCFLALEYVEGQTLDQLMDAEKGEGRALPLTVALEAMVQVLKGLGYAHSLRSPEGEELGIVHRDLKPGNIMLSKYGLVKVMDFGIAKARIASANITTAGQVRGTPIYMAPEQVTGKELDGRADQFAAATVLYELLTGRQLFIADNLVRIMQRVARAEVDEQVHEVAGLHPGVAPIIARMWAKRAEDRYPSCDEPAQLLEDIVFELKAYERARRIAGASSPGTPAPAPPKDPGSHEGSEASGADSSFLSALSQFMRKIFGTEKAPPPPKRRKRKRKKAVSTDAPTQTRVVSQATPAPRPVEQKKQAAPSASDSMEVIFNDDVSDFDLPVVESTSPPPNLALASKTEPAPKPAAAAPPAPKAAPGPKTAPPAAQDPRESAPTPVEPLAAQPDPADQSLDPFFYENFD